MGVVAVGGRQLQVEWGAAGIRNDVALGAGLTAVGRLRARRRVPPWPKQWYLFDPRF